MTEAATANTRRCPAPAMWWTVESMPLSNSTKSPISWTITGSIRCGERLRSRRATTAASTSLLLVLGYDSVGQYTSIVLTKGDTNIKPDPLPRRRRIRHGLVAHSMKNDSGHECWSIPNLASNISEKREQAW